MGRHEEDLKLEEEAFRMLAEIVRSPELLKAITGTSLKGETDPALDSLSESEKEKLRNLEMLEKKGFEVTELREKLLAGSKINRGMFAPGEEE